jgi:hypothetical protein
MLRNIADFQPYADRLDILELFARYCHAIDQCDWDLMRTVFSEDVEADYSSVANYTPTQTPIMRGVDDLIGYLRGVLTHVGVGLTYFMANHLPQGGFYKTRARRTETGWKIDRLQFEMRYFAAVTAKLNAHMKEIDDRTSPA